MASPGYAYMLRYTVQPGHEEDNRLESLVEFCQKARIDDVMFFINGEELNRGHLTKEETGPWMEMIARGQRMLRLMGVTASINPWPSLLHSARGRSLREHQNFRLMTDRYGNRSSATVCPLCPEWRKYFIEMYAYYAQLRPYSLWIEDDFRFHNHRPLLWGGCFCEQHMREFATKELSTLQRESFVNDLLKKGVPHQNRAIWLDHCRQTMVDLARDIAESVHRVSPETRIGLMTSSPNIHASEGRDWHGLFYALSGNKPAFIRPHLPAYSEECGFKYWGSFNSISRLTAALIPETTEVYPELENFPFSLFSKSKAFQIFQLETALLLGSQGVTMNIFDMMGNGIYPEEHYELWLAEEKDFLNSIASLNLHVKDQQGVQVLVNEKSAYTLHTVKGEKMEELYPNETFWASVLSAFGIANCYKTKLPQQAGIVAVSGQFLRNLDELEIRDIFAANIVLLEGEAASTLYEMGLGSLCGISNAVWHSSNSGAQAYEQISNNRVYEGISAGRMTAQIAVGYCLEVEYSGAVQTISHIHNAEGDIVCPGMTIVGGRVFILPYGLFLDSGYQALLNPIRRAVIRETLLSLPERPPLMASDYAPHVAVYYFENEGKKTVAIANTSSDDLDALELVDANFNVENWKEEDWMDYSRLYPKGRPAVLRQYGNHISIEGKIPALSLKVLHKSS